jgi:hypothetical protein
MEVLVNLFVATVLAEGAWTGQTIRTQGDTVVDVAYASDGSALFVVVDHGTIQKRSLDDGVVLWRRETDRRCDAVAAAPSGRHVATAGSGDKIDVRDADTGDIVSTINTPRSYFHGVIELQFVDRGNALIAAGRGGRILYAELGEGKTRSLEVQFGKDEWPQAVSAFAVSDKLKLVAAATRCSLTRFVRYGESEFTESIGDTACCPLHVPVSAIAFAADGTVVVTATNTLFEHEVVIWSVDGAKVMETGRLRAPCSIEAMFFVEGTNRIAAVSSEGVICWDLVEKVETSRKQFEGWSVQCAAYCAVRGEIAVGLTAGTLARIDVSNRSDR